MAQTMQLCRQTPIAQYGSQMAELRMYPSNPNVRIRCPDGTMMTAVERLAKLPNVPSDDRSREVSAAVLVTAMGGLLEGVDIFTDYDPIANAILTLMGLTLVVDNAYDVVKSMTQFVSQQIVSAAAKASANTNNNNADQTSNDKNNNNNKKPSPTLMQLLPDKDQLPFGLGTGKTTGVVVQGYTRLLTNDPEREAGCESAAFVTAYILGLPCYAFRSNVVEATSLLLTTATNDNATAASSSSSSSSSLVFRILVWLMAPVAWESASHPILIFTDPNEAIAFMDRCEELFGANDNDDRVFWNASNRDMVLKWAYHEADLLLRDNKRTVTDISQRLAGGAATIGDCVAVLEQW